MLNLGPHQEPLLREQDRVWVMRMAFETPREFRLPKDASLAKAMEELRQQLDVGPDSRLELEPAAHSVANESSKAAGRSKPAATPEEDSSGTSAPEIYSRLVGEGTSFVARRVVDSPLITRQHSLSKLRLNLEECRVILKYLESGPRRSGTVGKLKNRITSVTQRALNWFITPSITFDRAAADALNECATSLDLLSRQVKALAQDLVELSGSVRQLQLSQQERSARPESTSHDSKS